MTFHRKKFAFADHGQPMHDVLLVSSFAVWAMLIGFAPIITYRLLFS
jgi:hypothetical protein